MRRDGGGLRASSLQEGASCQRRRTRIMAWMDCIGSGELSALRFARLKSNPPTHAAWHSMHSLGPDPRRDAEFSSLQVSTAGGPSDQTLL